MQIISDEQKHEDPIKQKPKENNHSIEENPNIMSRESQLEPLKLEPIPYLKFQNMLGGLENNIQEESKSKINKEELFYKESLLQNKLIEDQLIKVISFIYNLLNSSFYLCRILRT